MAAGADTLVLAAATGRAGYDERPALDGEAWETLLSNLDRLAEEASRRGIRATLHPHVGTIVESPSDVQRVLDGSSIALCLDTGHLLIGGTDPGELAVAAADRIAHAHLKDVDGSLADRVRAASSATRRRCGRGYTARSARVTWTSLASSGRSSRPATRAGT